NRPAAIGKSSARRLRSLARAMAGLGHEGWFLPESLNGGCRSSKETSAKTRRAALETPIPAADDIAHVTTPPGERSLELNDRTPQPLGCADLAMAQIPAGIGRQRYCHIGQPNTAKLIAVRIDRRDEMWISLALPWRQRCGNPVCCLPAEIETRDPRRMRWKLHSRNPGDDGLHR